MTAWTIFTHPMALKSTSLLWLVIPLCASVAITYKTIRTNNLRQLPLEVLMLVIYMVVGLAALCAGLYLLFSWVL